MTDQPDNSGKGDEAIPVLPIALPRSNETPTTSGVGEPYELAILSGPATAQVFPLWKPSTLVGRDPTCDVFIPDPWVSRMHCRITREAGKILVEDLNAANATTLRGRPLRGTEPIGNDELLHLSKLTLARIRRQAEEGARCTVPAAFLKALEQEHLRAEGDSALLLLLRVEELLPLVAKLGLEATAKVIDRMEEVVRKHTTGRDLVARCGLDHFAILTNDKAVKLARKVVRDVETRRFVADDLIFSLNLVAAALPIPSASGANTMSAIKLFGSATQAAFLATRSQSGEIVRLDHFQP